MRARGSIGVSAAVLALFFGVGCDCTGDVGSGTPCDTTDGCPTGEVCLDGHCRTGTDGGGGADGGDGGGTGVDGGVDAGDTDAGTLPPGECVIEPAPSAFENPALELHWDATGLPFPGYSQTIHSPVVIDFIPEASGDVVPEILIQSYSTTFGNPGVLRVISGRPPYTTLMTLAGDGTGPVVDDTMATPSILKDAHPAAADLDGDGHPEVVVVIQGGGLAAHRNDGSEYWRVSAADLPAAEINANASVAIHDLEGDGVPEVIVGRVVIEGRTGVVRFTGTGSRGKNGQGPLSCVADVVPTSPGQEIIAGDTVYATDGTILWRAADMGDGFCAIADVVDPSGAAARDGLPEVIRVANGVVRIHDGATGAELFNRALPACMSAAGRGGAPTVADFEGDGLMEIGVAGSFCYSVIDPGCVGTPLPAGCTGNGLLWRTATEDNSSNVTSSTVFDFNGDGRAEVVYNDEQYFQVLDGVDGTVLFREPNPSRTRTEQPIVADVDNDGNAEIVFSANTEAAFAGDGIPAAERLPGLEIWSSADDTWVGARPIWNQHTYHISSVDDAGRIISPEPGSWLTHNTYRLNAPGENALAAPDLTASTVSTDTSRCGEGILTVCAVIFNRGDVRVGPGLDVVFYEGDPDAGGTEIGTTTTTSNIDRGDNVTVCIDWVGAPTTPTRVWVRVDAGDMARECIEDNNLVDLGEVRCSTIE